MGSAFSFRQFATLVATAFMLTAVGNGKSADQYWYVKAFDCEVVVQPSGLLLVHEIHTIQVVEPLKYGIRRALPIGSDDRWDRNYGPGYTKDTGLRVHVSEVKLDGQAAPFFINEMRGNHYQVVLGTGEHELYAVAVGAHELSIAYTVSGAVQLLESYDQLYWNAPGHGLSLSGDGAVRVHLPAGVPSTQVSTISRAGGRGVSSPRLASDPKVIEQYIADGRQFSIAGLRPYQSLAVVVRWPKGYVHEPPWWDRTSLHLILAPVLLLLFYVSVRCYLRRDQQPGAVLPQYSPPRGLSPAALRYVATGGADGTSVAAVLAHLIVKGAISVAVTNDAYTFLRQPGYDVIFSKLAPEEAELGRQMFDPAFNFAEDHSADTVVRDQPLSLGISGPRADSLASTQPTIKLGLGDPRINSYVGVIYSRLRTQLEGKYFSWNAGYVLVGIIVSFAFALFSALRDNKETFASLFLVLWIMAFTQIGGTVIALSIRSARAPRSASHRLLMLIALGMLVGFPLLAGRELASQTSWPLVGSILAMITINSVFIPLLRTMTPEGRRLEEEIAGYKEFIREVEQDQLDRLSRIADAPPRSETLPYAIALGVREAWGDSLADAMSQATVAR